MPDIGSRLAARRHARVLVLILAPLFLLAACTGSPSSTSSWQSTSDRALGTLISGLGTARIVLVQDRQDDVFHSYAVVTVTDAIETSSKEISSYLVVQPPDALHGAQAEVARALQDAAALLAEVRVTLASPGPTRSEYQRLITAIDDMSDQLDHLDSTVKSSPGSVGS